MEHPQRSSHIPVPSGYLLAPLHDTQSEPPTRLCVLVRQEVDPAQGAFVLLRDAHTCQVYLGALADAAGRIQDWLEIWVQSPRQEAAGAAGTTDELTNTTFDERWKAEVHLWAATLSRDTLITRMEEHNPRPVLIHGPGKQPSPFATTELSPFQLCRDEALLDSLGLPAYGASCWRYLYQPGANPATLLAVDPEAPANAHVQPLDRLKVRPEIRDIFNPQAGLLHLARLRPIGAEEFLQVLEGQAWEGSVPGAPRLALDTACAEFQGWSAKQTGLPFLRYSSASPAERLHEILFLKLSLLSGMFKEVRRYTKAQQMPLLNLTPQSFGMTLPETGEQFPALWAIQCSLIKPSQAHPLQLKSTEQKYFVRLGRIEPSPYLPEGLGAHSFGRGSIRLRNVFTNDDGTVLEGTLVAEDYLSVDSHDLLWFRLPLEEQRLEFHAHVYTGEAVGPREARFRTVPSRMPEALTQTLKRTLTTFARSPYEIWPLLSSPCDLHSLGVLAIRTLLANGKSNLPVVIDDVLGLARHVGEVAASGATLGAKLHEMSTREPRSTELLGAHHLAGELVTAEEARRLMSDALWLDVLSLLLRLFPGASTASFCKNLGDVPPLALETVFDGPIQELDALVLRLRSMLAPSVFANEEIAAVLLEEMNK
jgi:hypothetical protein